MRIFMMKMETLWRTLKSSAGLPKGNSAGRICGDSVKDIET